MFACLGLALAIASTEISPPIYWANGLSAPPRLPLVGDVNGDGLCDTLAVYPAGDCIIDVSLNVGGIKSGIPFQGLTGWGKDCQSAVCLPVDGDSGDDIVGIFGGKQLRVAGKFQSGRFQDLGVLLELPKPLDNPQLCTVANGQEFIALSSTSGRAFIIDSKLKSAREISIPAGTAWVGKIGNDYLGLSKLGQIFVFRTGTWTPGLKVAKINPASRPTVIGDRLYFDDQYWEAGKVGKWPGSDLPKAQTVLLTGDIDGDKDLDIFEFRFGTEMHTGNQVLAYRTVSTSDKDSDSDGLTNEAELALGTDPYCSDTDSDGLDDGWEVNGFRDLDLKAMGCSPLHTDMICLVSRFDDVNEGTFKSEMDRVIKFYSQLATPNPDKTTGFNFHPIYLETVKGDDKNNAWWTNRDKFLPAKWKGVVHWMQVTKGGGGQADQLGDGGSVAENALWAVFVHEFGHQMGMDHEGFWPNSFCPIYTSLMNYAYSYGLEDDYNKIHYSDGRLKDFILRETDLDETIPLPFDQVKFLEKGPYRFRLKAAGAKTLIDWNWNGIFGEKHVRADINYAYATNAGVRDGVGKTQSAPWLFTHEKEAYVLYGEHDFAPDKSTDPSISALKPGRLMLRKLNKPFEWAAPVTIESGGLIGDPVGASFGKGIVVVYQTKAGVVMRKLVGSTISLPLILDADSRLVPTVGLFAGKMFVFLTDPTSGMVTYKILDSTGKVEKTGILDATSTNPVGMCTDSKTGEAILALAQNQDAGRPNRWQIRRYQLVQGKLKEKSLEWVDGEKGQSRGVGRLTVLFDASPDAGKDGRVLIFGKGMTDANTPWSCTYVAQQIVDKTVNAGWIVKRFYDEWTQTRSAPAAAWFNKNIIWAYRWVDGGQGDSDNVLHVGYSALGIDTKPMGDHDDLTFFRTWGIRNSIMYLSNP